MLRQRVDIIEFEPYFKPLKFQMHLIRKSDNSWHNTSLFTSVYDLHQPSEVAFIMAVRLCVRKLLRKFNRKTGLRCMSYYPIDEHVFGLDEEQQQVIH